MALTKARCSLGESLSRTRAIGLAAPSSHSSIKVAWALAMAAMVRLLSAGSGRRSANPARSRAASTPLTVGRGRPRREARSPAVGGPPRSCWSAAARADAEVVGAGQAVGGGVHADHRVHLDGLAA